MFALVMTHWTPAQRDRIHTRNELRHWCPCLSVCPVGYNPEGCCGWPYPTGQPTSVQYCSGAPSGTNALSGWRLREPIVVLLLCCLSCVSHSLHHLLQTQFYSYNVIVWRHFGLHTTPVLSLVHSNPLFTPAVVDRAFSMWNEHGFVFMKYFFNLWHICLIQPVNSWLQSTFQSFLQIFMNQKLC